MKILKFSYLFPVFVLGVFLFSACTDLKVDYNDSIFTPVTGATFAGNANELLTSAYSDLNDFQNQDYVYSLTEHVTDEMIPPTRGTDWGDNGVWRTLHAHTWDPTHTYVVGSWNRLNGRVFKCNQVLASNNPAPTAQQVAEAKFLRAFYMFHIMDFWGQVPFRGVDEGVEVNPRVMSRSEAFDFVEKDLLEAIPALPVLNPGGDATQASKAAARTLLAKLYLNKAVYKAANPAGPYNFDPADMQKVIDNCDSVMADGFMLEPEFFDIFKTGATKEIIFTANNNNGSPSNRVHMTLHYNNNPSGWNGFTTLSDFYAKFEDGDQRKGKPGAKDGTRFSGLDYGFLIGQQYSDTGDTIINGRNGKPLSFTSDVSLTGASSEKGIRVLKYHPEELNNDPKTDEYAKYIFLRLGDVITMKAEAQFRSGGDAAGTLNTLRAVRAPGLTPLGTLTETDVLDERGRELYWEGWRRNDLVRFGKFNTERTYMKNVNPYTVLYPIPKIALDSNPNLKQNDGYK